MPSTPPDALLLVAPGCPHCAAVLAALAELVKKGTIGRLEVVNIAIHPDAAQAVGTRSVPWIRIGTYELTGNYTQAELTQWAERAQEAKDANAYIKELLEQQRLDQAVAYAKAHPEQLPALLTLLQEKDQSLTVRFGLGALFEELADTPALAALVPALGELSRHDQANLRADAAHYLGLSGSAEAIPFLEPLLEDPDPNVREIAADSLERLEGSS